MRIITSGFRYADIDAYAGCVAYAELLQKQGVDAQAVSTAPLNESICKTIRSWQAPIQNAYTPSDDDTYTLIDISEPEYFEKIVAHDRIDEIIDHHPGFESYWQEKIGDKSQIEFIGAACTLVYERWRDAGLLREMSMTSARLLVSGILDNTLSFGAKITTPRDVDAYNVLLAQSELPADWTAQYFTECQDAILDDIVVAIQNDTKLLSFKSFDHPICFGQLVVWDAEKVLSEHQDVIQKTLENMNPNWFMNLISVGERKSYFVTDNEEVQAWLTKLLNVQFDGKVATAEHLWLRKEVIMQDISNTPS